jgi:hypothetical protein
MVAKAAGLPRRWPWYLVGAGAVLWGFAASLWLRGFDGPDVVYPYESVTNDLWNVGSAMLAFGLGAIAGRAINPRRTVAPKRVV